MTLDELDRFNWVEARADCDAERLFHELREIVRSDCESARKFSKKRSELMGIVLETSSDFSFAVSRGVPESRCFQLEGGHIIVTDLKGKALYESTARLVENQCLIEYKGEYYKPWQFSQKVLEEFFFNPDA